MGVDINHCVLEGRLGADPEGRVLTSGTNAVRARIAVSDDYKDRFDQWQQRTHWITIQAYQRAADELAQFKKGDRIMVIGKWTVDEYTKDGRKQFYNKLEITQVRGSEHRRDTTHRQQAPAAQPAHQQSRDLPTGNVGNDFDDDIPF